MSSTSSDVQTRTQTGPQATGLAALAQQTFTDPSLQALAKQLPVEKAAAKAAETNLAAGEAALTQTESEHASLEQAPWQVADAHLQAAHYTAQRQRYLSIQQGLTLKQFLPIAIAFGVLAGKATGGSIANGVAVMAQGLAGFANGKVQQQKQAFDEFDAAMKNAQEEYKDETDRIKQVMSNSDFDLNTRLKQVELETSDVRVRQAAYNNDVKTLANETAKREGYLQNFKKAYDKAADKLNPALPPALQKAAFQALDQHFTKPPASFTGPGPASMMNPAYLNWQNEVKNSKTSETALAYQIAQTAKLQLKPGMSYDEAVGQVLGTYIKTGQIAPGVYHFGQQEKDFSLPNPADLPGAHTPGQPAPSSAARSVSHPGAQSASDQTIAIGGKTFTRADIHATALERHTTDDAIIAQLRAKLGHG